MDEVAHKIITEDQFGLRLVFTWGANWRSDWNLRVNFYPEGYKTQKQNWSAAKYHIFTCEGRSTWNTMHKSAMMVMTFNMLVVSVSGRSYWPVMWKIFLLLCFVVTQRQMMELDCYPFQSLTIQPTSRRDSSGLFLGVIWGSDVCQVLQRRKSDFIRLQTFSAAEAFLCGAYCTTAEWCIPDPTSRTWGTPPLGLCCQGQGAPSPGKHLALYSGKKKKKHTSTPCWGWGLQQTHS